KISLYVHFRHQPQRLAFPEHETVSLVPAVRDIPFQYGLADRILNGTYHLSGGEPESVHHVMTRYRWLPITDLVPFFHILKLLLYELEILSVFFLLIIILCGHIGMA